MTYNRPPFLTARTPEPPAAGPEDVGLKYVGCYRRHETLTLPDQSDEDYANEGDNYISAGEAGYIFWRDPFTECRSMVCLPACLSVCLPLS